MSIEIEAVVSSEGETEIIPPAHAGEVIRRAQSYLLRNYPNTGETASLSIICQKDSTLVTVHMNKPSATTSDPHGFGSKDRQQFKVTSGQRIVAGPLRLRGI